MLSGFDRRENMYTFVLAKSRNAENQARDDQWRKLHSQGEQGIETQRKPITKN